MNGIIIKRSSLIIGAILWWLTFVTLSITHFNNFQILNIIGFLFLVLVPGTLTVLSLKLKDLPSWASLSLSVGFSILELMLVGLIGNFLLPIFGIARPLAQNILLVGTGILLLALSSIAWKRLSDWELNVQDKLGKLFPSKLDSWLSFFPIIFVALSILGTISLNNGGSNIWTMVMLGGMGVYIIFLIYYAKSAGDSTIPTALFFMALSLLLMTSLRGWYITGHDIQSEFKVFELAKNAGIWSIAAFRDPYNACLSITILPTVFFNLLKVPDQYIYKFFFQIFFAFCPVLVYLIGRHWTSHRISLLGTIYFIAFPTFFTDMPFLIRQEVAFLFYGLMLYIIFEHKLDLSIRRWLFVLMGIGVVLSHYSTTYTILLVFGLAVISRPIFSKLQAWFEDKPKFGHNAIIPSFENSTTGSGKITLAMVAVLLALSFLWTSIITKTSDHLVTVVAQTISAVKGGFAGNNRSIDINTLLSFSKPDQNQELRDYIAKTVGLIRKTAPVGQYYSEQAYSQYSFTALGGETVPLSNLGKFLESFGVNAATIVSDFGQLLQKLMEILVPLGMIYLLFGKSIIKYVDDELYLIAFYCLFFIALNIILPILSTEYGIFRAMQQSMFIIAPIIVIGSIMLGNGLIKLIKPLGRYLNGEKFAIIFAVVLFFYSSAFIPQLFGGNLALLHLNNNGIYYDKYLIKAAEVYGVEWLGGIATINSDSANGVKLEIQTDGHNKFASLAPPDARTNIFPGLIRKESYVFLSSSVVTKQRATAVQGDDAVTYKYPIQFLDDNKNLIYSNGVVKIYR